eukprot:TRINITY_DN8550_c0_g1_i1.p1 TRINITY_DN8550_c0_g1~~TRINITY_DN8550_c0_g1_i1.p1  ORF type:complete len:241 (-),score=77.06 TRINITY_DN8550_c0_g1_i1:25-747(-)
MSTRLEDVLKNPVASDAFLQFLSQSFAEENLLFYNAVEQFKMLGSNQEMIQEAQRIYNQFIELDAAQQINITSDVKKIVDDRIAAGDITAKLFDGPQAAITFLMETDCLPKFVQSKFESKSTPKKKASPLKSKNKSTSFGFLKASKKVSKFTHGEALKASPRDTRRKSPIPQDENLSNGSLVRGSLQVTSSINSPRKSSRRSPRRSPNGKLSPRTPMAVSPRMTLSPKSPLSFMNRLRKI